jgi:hypothetical protein
MTKPHSLPCPLAAVLMSVALTACPDASDDTADPASTGAPEDSTSSTTGGTTDTPTTSGTTGDDPTSGTTGGEELTRIEKILKALGVSMYECPERIWPNVEFNYRNRQVLLVSESMNLAWLWNDQETQGEPPGVIQGPLDSLPVEWNAVFNVGTLQGVPTLGISYDYTGEINADFEMNGMTVWPDFAVVLTFHEGFHFLSDQNDWNDGNGSRTAPYPEPWEPRYLRAALIDALRDEALGMGGGLGAAAHWYGRLQAEHGPEMQQSRPYDITEGTAEYASLMMSALAELGCAAGDAELLELAKSHLLDGVFLSLSGSFDPGREFYDLGVVSGLLLRGSGAVADWELKVEDGAPPAELLLAGVAAAAQPDDPALQAAAQAAVDERNTAVGMEIEPMLGRMSSADHTRIAVDFNWLAGSFGVGGFYYLADDPQQPEVFLRFSGTFDPPSGKLITVDNLSSLIGVSTPCALSGGSTIVFTVPNDALAVMNGLATSTDAKVMFSGLVVEPTMDANNLPWLCLVDGGGVGNAPPAPDGPIVHVLRTAGHGALVP